MRMTIMIKLMMVLMMLMLMLMILMMKLMLMMMKSMSGVTLRTDEWENLEPEIASKAKRSAAAFNFATANGDVLILESSRL